MTPSNFLAFVYYPLVAGTFGSLMNIACTVIIFTLYLSALCVGGWAGSPGMDRPKNSAFLVYK